MDTLLGRDIFITGSWIYFISMDIFDLVWEIRIYDRWVGILDNWVVELLKAYDIWSKMDLEDHW